MTSLYPGLLFYSTGLNKKSTPTKPEATPSEIDQQLGRVAFNGRPWPKSSPVSSVYDVRNSSTRMIILNNKLSRRPKGSRLRGQTDHQGEIQTPQPNRHVQEEPKTNCDHHKNCNTYNSEKFVPVFPPSTPSPAWVNNQQRPPMKFDNGSLVNPNHHIHCQGHMDYDIMRWYNAQRSRPRSRVSIKEEERSLSPILQAPGLKPGEKRYLSSIARIYSVSDMKAQTTDRYKQLMNKEIGKDRRNTEITMRLTNSQYGLRTYKYSDWDKYHRYLNTPRKTQFGPCDTFKEKSSRSASAPGTRKPIHEVQERPHTTHTTVKSANSSARSSAKAPRGVDRRKETTRKSGRPQTSGDVSGKPARVESPLPLKPKDSVSPSPSESDMSDVNESPKKIEKTEEVKAESPKSESPKAESPKAESPKSGNVEETQRAEVEAADEDERSKMSAREGNEQRGDNVEYHPTYGDLRDERSKEATGSSQNDVPTSEKETYQPTESAEKSGSQVQIKAESPKAESPKHQSPSGSAEDVKSKSAVSVASLGDKKSEGSAGGKEERPLSRLGGSEQFNVVQKDNNNSDDDYSDDDDVASQKNKGRGEEAAVGVKDNTQTGGSLSSQQVDDKMSQGTEESAATEQKTEKSDVTATDATPTDATPTEATPTEGSQEKPSDISTIDY